MLNFGKSPPWLIRRKTINVILLRLGTRGSLLARAQSQQVADAVMAASPGIHVELVILKTTGDQVQDRPLADLGGKGLFTKELEQALLDGRVDFAVHSYKDVPVTMPLVDVTALKIDVVPRRVDPRDVLVTREGLTVERLPPSAKVGTGSLRRKCQLRQVRPDLRVEGIRGNIDSRLRKLAGGEFDAIVLAAAGLHRAGMFDPKTMIPLAVDAMIPSPGQGALAIQTRREDVHTLRCLIPLHDPITARCVAIERHVVLGLNGDCHSPIAAYAEPVADGMRLYAALGQSEGVGPVRRAVRVWRNDIEDADLVRQVVADLSAAAGNKV